MSAHKTHPRQKPQPPRPERDRGKPMVQPNMPSLPAPVNTSVAQALPSAPPRLPTNGTHASPVSVAPSAPSMPAGEGSPAPTEDLPAPATPVAPTSFAIPVVPPPPRAAQNGNGDHHPQKHVSQRTPTPLGELSEMFATMRALFAQDRTNGARADAARCGICYLTFPREQLIFREEDGFYACPECDTALSHQPLPMLRRQRK